MRRSRGRLVGATVSTCRSTKIRFIWVTSRKSLSTDTAFIWVRQHQNCAAVHTQVKPTAALGTTEAQVKHGVGAAVTTSPAGTARVQWQPPPAPHTGCPQVPRDTSGWLLTKQAQASHYVTIKSILVELVQQEESPGAEFLGLCSSKEALLLKGPKPFSLLCVSP